jgi:type III secretion system YscI/HrpB-like protein
MEGGPEEGGTMIRDVEGGCRFVGSVADAAPAAGDGAPRVRDEASSGFRSVLLRLREAEAQTDAWVEKALGRGGLSDPQELLRLQVTVHRFQVQVELAAKVVDQLAQGVRTLTRPG